MLVAANVRRDNGLARVLGGATTRLDEVVGLLDTGMTQVRDDETTLRGGLILAEDERERRGWRRGMRSAGLVDGDVGCEAGSVMQSQMIDRQRGMVLLVQWDG